MNKCNNFTVSAMAFYLSLGVTGILWMFFFSFDRMFFSTEIGFTKGIEALETARVRVPPVAGPWGVHI